jgi:hypothetical protein
MSKKMLALQQAVIRLKAANARGNRRAEIDEREECDALAREIAAESGVAQ